jgi:hypothetical protein
VTYAGRAPDRAWLVEHAIQITTQDFRLQERLRTRERQAALIAGGAGRTMNSRHLTDAEALKTPNSSADCLF